MVIKAPFLLINKGWKCQKQWRGIHTKGCFRDKFQRHELEKDIYRCRPLIHVSEICLWNSLRVDAPTARIDLPKYTFIMWPNGGVSYFLQNSSSFIYNEVIESWHSLGLSNYLSLSTARRLSKRFLHWYFCESKVLSDDKDLSELCRYYSGTPLLFNFISLSIFSQSRIKPWRISKWKKNKRHNRSGSQCWLESSQSSILLTLILNKKRGERIEA